MVMRFLNSNADMLSLDTLISDEKYDKISDQSLMKPTESSLCLDLPDQESQQFGLCAPGESTGELNIVTAEDPSNTT